MDKKIYRVKGKVFYTRPLYIHLVACMLALMVLFCSVSVVVLAMTNDVEIDVVEYVEYEKKKECEIKYEKSFDLSVWGQSEDFNASILWICEQLGIPNPHYLMSVISFESAGTFSPSIRNMAGSTATGLIQFMCFTAVGLGTTTEQLAQMTQIEQLNYVYKYLRKGRDMINTLEDMYMVVLFPYAMGRGADFILFCQNGCCGAFSRPSLGSNHRHDRLAYTQNRGIDLNNDGIITVGEATERVRRHVKAKGIEL